MKNKLIPRYIVQDFPELGHKSFKGQTKAKTLSFLVLRHHVAPCSELRNFPISSKAHIWDLREKLKASRNELSRSQKPKKNILTPFAGAYQGAGVF